MTLQLQQIEPANITTVVQITLTVDQLRQIIRDEVQKAMATPAIPMPEIINRKQAAQMLSVTSKTIENYEKAGDLQRIELPGKIVRYRRKDIIKLKAYK